MILSFVVWFIVDGHHMPRYIEEVHVRGWCD